MEITDINNKLDLCVYLNISDRELNYLLYSKKCKYSTYFKRKKGKRENETRTINVPTKQLKYVQYMLAKGLSDYYEKRYNQQFVHGFIKGKSIVTNANSHKGRKYVLNLDIKNFFPSISFKRVHGFLTSKKHLSFNNNVAIMITNLIMFNDKLPQGSPSSPVMSNLICFNLDKQLRFLMNNNNDLIITRYADDVTLSTNSKATIEKFYNFQENKVTDLLRNTFEKNGFILNEEKTRIADKYHHQEVTGIIVNNKEDLNVHNYFLHKIRCILNCIKKYGFESAAKHFCERKHKPFGNKGKLKFLRYIAGLISYYRMVTKENEKFIRIAKTANETLGFNLVSFKRDYQTILDNCIFEFIDSTGYGSGTCIRIKDYFVTCKHCLFNKNCEEMQFLKFEICKGGKCIAKNVSPIYISKKYDIAFFEAKKIYPFMDYISLAQKEPKSGDTIKAIGFQYYDDEKNVCIKTPGIYGEKTFQKGTDTIYEGEYFNFNQQIYTGMSGGCALNENNDLVGLICIGVDPQTNKIRLTNGFLPLDAIVEELKKAEKCHEPISQCVPIDYNLEYDHNKQ